MVLAEYNPGAVICVGPPFGHIKPQWIVPYGGEIIVDGKAQQTGSEIQLPGVDLCSSCHINATPLTTINTPAIMPSQTDGIE